MTRHKVSDADLLAAYADLKSVWAVGARFKMAGQTAHRRLQSLGAVVPQNIFTDADRSRLLTEYEKHAAAGTISALARDMGRTKNFICRQARSLGLTDVHRKKPYLSATISTNARERIRVNGHPRGMKGKSHSAETKQALSLINIGLWAALSPEEQDNRVARQAEGRRAAGSTPPGRVGVTWKSGWREIGPHRAFFRSRWEANYARYLEWLRARGEIQSWEHEPETFWFDGIKRGAMSYLPDFRVIERNGLMAYHEVKGWMDARSKTKIARMGRYFPHIRLIVIDAKSYKTLARQMAPLIAAWE